MSDHKAGLERLGVLIGRTRSREVDLKMFLILGTEPPRAPQSMIETQRLEVVPMSTMLGA